MRIDKGQVVVEFRSEEATGKEPAQIVVSLNGVPQVMLQGHVAHKLGVDDSLHPYVELEEVQLL